MIQGRAKGAPGQRKRYKLLLLEPNGTVIVHHQLRLIFAVLDSVSGELVQQFPMRGKLCVVVHSGQFSMFQSGACMPAPEERGTIRASPLLLKVVRIATKKEKNAWSRVFSFSMMIHGPWRCSSFSRVLECTQGVAIQDDRLRRISSPTRKPHFANPFMISPNAS